MVLKGEEGEAAAREGEGLACDACRGFSTVVVFCIVYKDTTHS